MATTNLRILVGKLSNTCRKALESAAGLCLSRTNYNVEIEHWFLKLLEPVDSDLSVIVRQAGLDLARINRELTAAMEKFRTGNGRAPELSPEVIDLAREAWVIGTLNLTSSVIRSGHLLIAALDDRTLSLRLRNATPTLGQLESAKLLAAFADLTAGSAEASESGTPMAGTSRPGEPSPAVRADSKTPALDQFTVDLTERARAGQLDAVIGRDAEVRQVIDILTRRRQNNPILIGEAGVGKTAVVEGFALRIVSGDVPDPLKSVSLRSLDLGLLQAGAGVKGEFENRLKNVIHEVQSSPTPIILFIDEAHTLIGAGAGAGMSDAANLLKPALARGELRTVAATTFDEYKKSFENDPALKRRFQPVTVNEPDTAKAIAMMRGVAAMLERHHRVRILDEALQESVRLAQRYIPDRQLPDKSISLLDTACARVALSQSTTPAAIENATREIELLHTSIGILSREQATGTEHAKELAEQQQKLAQAQARLAQLRSQLAAEQERVSKIQAIRQQLEAALNPAGGNGTAPAAATPPADTAEQAALKAELAQLTDELEQIQGENPLIQPVVNGQAVAAVVAEWTGIPLGKMVRNEIANVLTLGEQLKQRIIGQDYAIDLLAQRVQAARAGLNDPRLPIGVFLLVGPSGVGKTETAIALADLLYGGTRNMTTINMSEYGEEMMKSRLTGPAPGLVGYGEGGVLTEPIRRRPYNLVLLDEMEKAHDSVQFLFYQVFDKGTLQDEKGRVADFKNTIILMTSNLGSEEIFRLTADPDTAPAPAKLIEKIRPALLTRFKDAFLGRVTVVPYYPLSDQVIRQIIGLKLKRVQDRIAENYRATFSYDEATVNAIFARCKEVESGARNVDKIINVTLLPLMSQRLLAHLAEGQAINAVELNATESGEFSVSVR
jgi:type VI secretion system protein VasG